MSALREQLSATDQICAWHTIQPQLMRHKTRSDRYQAQVSPMIYRQTQKV